MASSPTTDTAAGGGKVLIYSINFSPELTGVGRYTGEIATYLAANGDEVSAVTTPPHYPGWAVKAPFANGYSHHVEDGVKVWRAPLLLRREMRSIWRLLAPLTFVLSSAPVMLWRALRDRPAVVLAIEPTLLAAPVGLLAAKLAGARAVLHVQDLEIDAAFGVGHLSGAGLQKLAFAMERRLLSGFDHIVTISNSMRDRLVDKGVQPPRLSIVRNWVDMEKIRPMPGPNGFRAELGLGDDAFVALYSGNIGVKQALPVMLDAAERLVDQSNLTFVIAGDGPEKNKLVERYGALPNVRFLPLQPEARLCELLNLADIHLLPQLANTADLVLPSKLGGILASGKPVLATVDEGSELYGFLSGYGVLTPAGDVDAATAALRDLANGRGPKDLGNGRELAKRLDARFNLADFRARLFGRKVEDAPARNEAPVAADA